MEVKMYDVSLSHRIAVEENDKRIAELKNQFPDSYLSLSEVRKLLEANRQHERNICQYEKMIERGVKF